MPLVALGLSHRTAPVDVRERHAFAPARMVEALIALRDYEAVREAAMLSTCGRLEIYAELDDYEAGVEQLKAFLQNFRHGDVADMESYLYTLLGRDAIEHLFRVSTGLDSMLIGEAEILGQVKDAYVQAQAAKSIGKTLHRLFKDAIAAGKTARSQTQIGKDSVSIATAAIEMARRRLGTLEGKAVAIVGAGKMGRTASKRLRSAGISALYVVNRTPERARQLLEEAAGEAVDLASLDSALARVDVVVTSTGASHFILTPHNVVSAMAQRPERPLFVVDIAVPRDADPQIAQLPNVSLVDIDALKDVVDTTLQTRRQAVPRVEEIIAEFVTRFMQWYRTRSAIPVITSLTQKAEAIRQAEIERLFARCPDLTERERMLITGSSLSIISRLLHTVITRIRERAGDEEDLVQLRETLLHELFDLPAVREEQPK
ncbi:MAG: glutamyl-tRNA reductase [Candidatus Eremiobacteraeota bacterium]|nr:glutamyl-tRNA reductase [Candidatus Eremiobacteraeota bacterium]